MKFYSVVLFAVLLHSCSREKVIDQKNSSEMGKPGSKLYTIRVLELFQPKEIILRLQEVDRCKIQTEKKTLSAVDAVIIRVDGERIAFTTPRKTIHGARGKLELLNGREYSGKFSIVIPDRFERKYSGGFRVELREGALALLVSTSLENLVAVVTASESSASDPDAYFCAQSIVARSFIVASKARHDGYDYCDNTHCQVYFGEDAVTPQVRTILKSTRGVVLLEKQQVFPAQYSGACGGSTTRASRVWHTDTEKDFSSAVSCDACSTSQYYRWRRSISSEEFERVFDIPLSRVTAITIDTANSRAPGIIRLHADHSDRVFSPDEFRLWIGRTLGWNKILSNQFSLTRTNNTLDIVGKGFGHGVGFCQEGAKTRARNGMTHTRILQYYFPNATLSSSDQTPRE